MLNTQSVVPLNYMASRIQLCKFPEYECLHIVLDTSIYNIQGKWFLGTPIYSRICLHILPHSETLDISNAFGQIHQ